MLLRIKVENNAESRENTMRSDSLCLIMRLARLVVSFLSVIEPNTKTTSASKSSSTFNCTVIATNFH